MCEIGQGLYRTGKRWCLGILLEVILLAVDSEMQTRHATALTKQTLLPYMNNTYFYFMLHILYQLSNVEIRFIISHTIIRVYKAFLMKVIEYCY